ncbi:MAG: hypothetical protein Q7R81_01740 [Candidatus Peregrinibacteria bacterium]|nr:hypothetical protein [Candidatus Peregrinibacteria bacterium]
MPFASKRVLARVHGRSQLGEFRDELFHGKGGGGCESILQDGERDSKTQWGKIQNTKPKTQKSSKKNIENPSPTSEGFPVENSNTFYLECSSCLGFGFWVFGISEISSFSQGTSPPIGLENKGISAIL